MHLFVSIALTALASTVSAATFDWDCTNALGTCQNYCFYAQCRGGAGQQFTYDADKSKRPDRRKESGCSKTPCSDSSLSYSKFGNSCDEFPFASTKEGGSGARLRCVDSTENSSEGGQLSAFYGTINDGDKFGITIENWKGASSSYCEDNPTCTNDGGEFFLDPTGNFVDGKRSIAGRGLMLDPGSSTPAAQLRTVKTEDGGEHLVIAEDGANPLKAGDEIWSARRNATLKIVD
ncbi:conserved hypothetical protein [Aspergillus terreus NIH2624]|uniref:Deoxyribonuclease NucA/NucB domain-containing protein n=1 Tax=Aspergillus terreus (strain NIH 2624 / FGSC A1156) TaxID=341663 RepID=Q0CVU6_ASPTN|nr:uncharacterized protein ATEG_02188 [Aspergillus terreus NIH2624]EAU37150.1 conserved hypothetical protein [Aspergillus terreus NIH2624]